MREKKDIKGNTATKLGLAGGGAGLMIFAIYGIVDASFIGGLMGLNLAGLLMGFPVESALLSRGLVALGMLSGVFFAGVLFVSIGASTGWLLGKLIDIIRRVTHHTEKELAVISH